MYGCEEAPRPTGSFFSVLEDLERAASQLPATAEFSRQVANRYLGPPELSGSLAEGESKELEDANVVRRLRTLVKRIDNATGAINYNLNRLSE